MTDIPGGESTRSSKGRSGAKVPSEKATDDVESSLNEDGENTLLFPAIKQLEKANHRIDTGHQFLEWLHSLEASLQTQDDAPYRQCMEGLERQSEDANQLLSQVSFLFSL